MRSFLAGLLILLICGPAFGQATGFVQQIGFGKSYRPYGWTPMLINLTSTIGDPAEYEIQVRQEDLDRDRVIFRRDIVLNPNKQEQFWVYFLAQPKGFDDRSAASLNKNLDVRLCTKSGKPLIKLGIQDPLQSLDPDRQPFGAVRGMQLVLMVSDAAGSGSAPAVREFSGAIGLNEDIAFVRVTPFDLPENVIGYDPVDAIVWLDADAGNLTTGGSRRLAAMTEYVRAGGRLVVCQSPERFKIEAFADVLPVEMKNSAGDWLVDVRDRATLDPLPKLAKYHSNLTSLDQDQEAGWKKIEQRGPFKVAFAKKLRDGAVGEEWIDWNGDGSERSPWLARRPLGMGSVTWVAQDLGNRTITGKDATGWANVWDDVLGQRDIDLKTPIEIDGNGPSAAIKNKSTYATNNSIDLGGAMLRGMDHEGRAGGLMFLAGVFFVGYWVIAGPVSYLVLAGKKRTELSWTIFAVSALGATLLTVGVVRLVLTGTAAVHHISLVRMLPAGRNDDGTPTSSAIVNSRIGLYISRDGKQTVKLLDNDKDAVSYIAPYSIHPAHQAGTSDFPAYLEYDVPVRDTPLSEDVSVSFPYRSTLKKIEARWVGKLNGGIDVNAGRAGGLDGNKPRLVPTNKKMDVPDAVGKTKSVSIGTINGALLNHVGTDLAHVYFVFNYPATYEGQDDDDYVLYVPFWKKDASIVLEDNYRDAVVLPKVGGNDSSQTVTATPGGTNTKSIRGTLIYRQVQQQGLRDWATFWHSGMRVGNVGDGWDDSRTEYLRSFPVLSLFQRVSPAANIQGNPERVEVLRRAAREFDVSQLVAAGQLVILAMAGEPGVSTEKSPLPFPMEVEGERMTGSGTTFYQFALPLDRSELTPPWTKTDDQQPPAEKPDATGSGAGKARSPK